MPPHRSAPDGPTASPMAWTRGQLAFGLAFPSVLTALYFVALAGAPRGAQQGVYLAGKGLQFGLPLAWYLRRPGRSWADLRLGRRGAGPGLAFGLAVLLAGLALYHGVLAPLGALAGDPAEAMRAKVAGLGVGGPARFLLLAAFYAVLHSLAEELYWRGFVYGGLRGVLRPAWAIVASSLGFAAHHLILLAVFFGAGSPWTWGLSLAVASGGAFWAWLYQRSGSLAGPWLGHLLVDAAIFAVGWDLVR